MRPACSGCQPRFVEQAHRPLREEGIGLRCQIQVRNECRIVWSKISEILHERIIFLLVVIIICAGYPVEIGIVVGQELNLLRELLAMRSEEHTSELQSLMRISYAVFCLKKTNNLITE